jgi:hypothetical protein
MTETSGNGAEERADVSLQEYSLLKKLVDVGSWMYGNLALAGLSELNS